MTEARRRSELQRVMVGLDYGTHSTKCVIQPRGTSSHALIQFIDREKRDEFPWFTEPSLVRLVGKRLIFGRKAFRSDQGILYPSLKMRLLEDVASEDYAYPDFPRGVSPDLLVACYLSRVLRIIKRSIDKTFGTDSTQIIMNMAAPMDHFEDEILKDRYLQIINAAWRSVFCEKPFVARSGMTVDEARRSFESAFAETIPPAEHRLFDVLPETIAPIVSLSQDPRMAAGFYLMFDMGAGTSEFSANLVNDRGADQKVVCYFDRTIRIGGDDFERTEAQSTIAAEQHAGLIDELMTAVRKTCFSAYQKDHRSSGMRAKWKHLRLLITGGAARRRSIEDALQELLPFEPYPPGEESYRVSWHKPMLNTGRIRFAPHEASLLAVAHGLSIHRRLWPTIFEPGKVEQLEGDALIEKPEAHWYAGK